MIAVSLTFLIFLFSSCPLKKKIKLFTSYIFHSLEFAGCIAMVPFSFENFWNTTQMTPVSLDLSMCFIGIFFQSLVCLFIFLTVLYRAEICFNEV